MEDNFSQEVVQKSTQQSGLQIKCYEPTGTTAIQSTLASAMGSVLKQPISSGTGLKMSCYSKVDINQDFSHHAKLRNKLDNRTETYINRFQALSDKIAQA